MLSQRKNQAPPARATARVTLVSACALGLVCLLAAEKKGYGAAPPQRKSAAPAGPKRSEPKPPPPLAEILPALAPPRADRCASDVRPVVRPPVRVLPMGDGGSPGAPSGGAALAWRGFECPQRATPREPHGDRSVANPLDGAILTAIRPLAPPLG